MIIYTFYILAHVTDYSISSFREKYLAVFPLIMKKLLASKNIDITMINDYKFHLHSIHEMSFKCHKMLFEIHIEVDEGSEG